LNGSVVRLYKVMPTPAAAITPSVMRSRNAFKPFALSPQPFRASK